MKKRPLGKTGIEISEIGYGSWAIGGNLWGAQDDEEARGSIRRALDLGLNFIDTAAVYGNGHSERQIGRVLKESGFRPIVATKIAPLDMTWPARPGTPLRQVFPASHIVRQTDESLRRLGVDRIDLQQLHVWTEAWSFENEWYDALMTLREKEKIHHFGISVNAFDPGSALEVVRSGRIASVQVVHNIFEQAPEDHLFPEAEKAGVGIIVRVPFDESSLTGKLTKDSAWPPDDFRSRYFAGDRLTKCLERVEKLRAFIPATARSLPRLALRYCLSHSAVSTVIPGIRSIAQAEENASASADGPLPAGIIRELQAHRWNRAPDEWD